MAQPSRKSDYADAGTIRLEILGDDDGLAEHVITEHDTDNMFDERRYNENEEINYKSLNDSTKTIPRNQVIPKIDPPKARGTQSMSIKENSEYSTPKQSDKNLSLKSDSIIAGGDERRFSFDEGVPKLNLYREHRESVGAYSYLPNYSEYDEEAHPPEYLPYQELLKDYNDKDVFKNLQLQNDGKILCKDQTFLDRQKDIILDLMKQTAKNILKGREVVEVSLPVRIFEPRSALERFLDIFAYAPYYMTRARETGDTLQKFKQIIAFATAGLHLSVSQLKPFNPIIGETFQGFYPQTDKSDGAKIYCEHTQINPSMTHFLIEEIEGRWKIHGHFTYVAHLSGNNLTIALDGPINVEIPKQGQSYVYFLPKLQIEGMMMGERTINYTGPMLFDDKTNNNKAIIMYNRQSSEKSSLKRLYLQVFGKADDIGGFIYLKKSCSATLTQEHVDLIKNEKDIDDIDYIFAYITGKWLSTLKISGVEYWKREDAQNLYPQIWHVPLADPLPSDWRYREDLIYLWRGEHRYSEKWKIKLEVHQRNEDSNRIIFERGITEPYE